MTTYTQLKRGGLRGTWGLRGPGLEPGQTVLVTRRDGSVSEETVGEIVHHYTDGIVVATKANVTAVVRRNGRPSGASASRQRAVAARAGYGRSGDAYGAQWEAEREAMDDMGRAELGEEYGT